MFENVKLKLSHQAMGALMMTLQKCLLEETDIIPLLREADWAIDNDGKLFIVNPPVVSFEGTEASNVTDFVKAATEES